MRTSILGLLVVLALVLTTPVVAAEETPWKWPSFELVGWVVELWDALASEMHSADFGPLVGPNGVQEPPAEEFVPTADPNGVQAPSTEELGPTGDPNGEDGPTEEMGPIADPWG